MPKIGLNEILKVTGAEVNFAGEKIFEDIVTDSRKISDGVLFVALKGENFNGENFAKDAIEKGAAGVVVGKNCSPENLPVEGIVFKVDDTLTAYQQIAGLHRDKFKIPVVGITGSNGKTTTKDLTAAALSGLGKIQKTAANFNNEIGVPLTLLGIEENCRAAVVEIGMRGRGQIESLAEFVKPNIGIVTTVNETHIEILGSLENIARAKAEMVEAIPSGGIVILNIDNPHIRDMKKYAAPGVKILTYALENPADFVAENISVGNTSTKFTLNCGGEKIDFEIPLLGRHNASNALAAIAAGKSLGLSFEEIQAGFKNLAVSKMRFEVSEKDGLTIINDAYNAGPASMAASIKTVAEVYKGRKIAVLGDMLELGDFAEKLHREVGREVAENNFDILITLGELGKFIAEGAKDSGLKNIFTTADHDAAAKKILEVAEKGDTILFKASHGMHMEKIIEKI